jgi:hypothetical protein
MTGHHPDPIFETHDDRLRAILGDRAGTFGFDSQNPYPGHTSYPNPWYSNDRIGDNAVSVNLSDISSAAEEFGVDSDLIEAVVYMENAHGWYDALRPGNSTARPGNVNAEIWAELLDVDPALVHSDSTINIRLTAKILSEIQERLVNPTPAAIATLYNSLFADQVSGYGLTIEEYMEQRPWETTQCFLYDTQIQMWPLDPSIKPRAGGSYDEELVLSKVWTKPISEITVGDLVLSYDDKGRIKPGPVSRTMQNRATHILEFWGTGVTPGHAYYCAEGKFKDQHVPLMDILRTDGAIVRDNGTLIRATTGCEVGSVQDQMIHVIIGDKQLDGSIKPRERAQIRLGTQVICDDNEHRSIYELITASGGQVTDDGYIQVNSEGLKMPFRWMYSEGLPKPEDYILARSKLTLEEIYVVGEWEQIGTRMQAPAGIASSFASQEGTHRAHPKPVPNIPPAFAARSDVPILFPIATKQ